MNEVSTETCSVVVEREFPHPPEKVWRALTQPHLIGEWLMKTDFRPVVDHRFDFRFDWGTVDCRVLEADPPKKLTYTWVFGDLNSVVTWTLTPSVTGVRLRMEQSGFRPDQPRYFGGAKAGWPAFLDNLQQVLTLMD